jgi:hypothetical protein
MGTVTKVMFGLIIISGGGGIFMALSIPGKVDALKTAKNTAEKSAQTYMAEIDTLKGELSVEQENLKNKMKDLAKVTKDFEAAKGSSDTLIENERIARQDKDTAESERDDYKLKWQKMENKFGQAQEGQRIAQENLAKLQQELRKLKISKNAAKPKRKPPAKVTKGVVKNVDPKYGFITIPLGEKDTKKGDVFVVKRAGKKIGIISVTNIRGVNSYCKVDKTQTQGMATNPLTGDIMVGDDVELQK